MAYPLDQEDISLNEIEDQYKTYVPPVTDISTTRKKSESGILKNIAPEVLRGGISFNEEPLRSEHHEDISFSDFTEI